MRKQFVAMALVMINVFGCMAGEAEEENVAEADQAVVAKCSVTCAIGDPLTLDCATTCTANQSEQSVSCTGGGPGHFDVTLYCPEPLCYIMCDNGDPLILDCATTCTSNSSEQSVSCTGGGPGHFDVTLFCGEPIEEVPMTPGETSPSP